MKAKLVSIVSGLLLLSLLMYVAGLITVHRDLFVWQKVMRVRQLVTSLRATGRDMPQGSYSRRAPHVPDQSYVISDREAIAPGMLAVTRLNPEGVRYVIDLIAEDGTLLHSWPVEHARLIPGGKTWESPHGTKVLTDGSALVAFNSEPGLARIDGCGDAIWAIPDQVYHHVIQADEAGGYWTWRSVKWGGSHDQVMLRFSESTGEALEAIDLVDDVILPYPVSGLLMATPEGFAFRRGAAAGEVWDIFHPNDIEPLPAALADAFPQFKAGDLLISLRNLDMVAVIDRETYRVLWVLQGPWRQQHDPDWQADGTITVFNNNRNRQLSHIVAVDPRTNELSLPLGNSGPKYFSDTMGNHERLPNGNWLIVSANEGRVIEVTGVGQPVREYSNVINDEYNAVVLHAEHLAPDFFATFPVCAPK
ncbi:MAG: arylsulfotransferase family protein [Gemmatimonadota bacterium]|nr:arylsulfotransferase family protein [Gemmatimonadota bacterium]